MSDWLDWPLDEPLEAGAPGAVASENFAIDDAFHPPTPGLARLAYDSAVERATVTATSAAPLRPANNLKTRDTYQTWRATAPEPVVTVLFAAPELINYVGIARHNMGSLGITALVEIETAGDGWLEVAVLQPDHDGPVMVPIAEVLAVNLRVSFYGYEIPTLAVLMAGKAVIMPRPLRATMQPVFGSRDTTVTPQISELGQLLGSVVVRNGVNVSPTWNNLTRDFYNDTLRLLAREMPGRAVMLMWQPLEHPDEVVFGMVSGDVTIAHIPRSARYTFGFSLSGVAPS